MDGYAVRAKDTFEASQFTPKVLGVTESEEVGQKEARQIWTGNPLPAGADAVVMLEHTEKVQNKIQVWRPVTPGRNVSKRGEDIHQGEIAVESGTRLKPQHIGLLAALGMTQIDVVKKPRAAILSTGDELIDLEAERSRTQMIDVNRPILSGMCQVLGAEAVDLGIARDNVDEIKAKIHQGLEKAEMVITTGGTSVGYDDLVPTAVNQIGPPGVVIHGIAIRPAMPTALAIIQGKPVILLSGNPVAAMIGFEVFARKLILKLLGIENEPRPKLKARLTRKVPAALGRRVYLRVRILEKNDEFLAQPVRIKGSGILSTMTKANGYVMIPESREGLDKGESVTVHLFDKIGA
ncbi:molybdopterin molybdenumtransferase MoeA [Candidatus Bathyarchaeota archaeon]|nr:molybdopterin molybdenumtransferase MoeA [Candidatus Bathyarchaeota archaeon]NIV67822.1 molybdopterin molybdenumtransferase MoeA [Candidatus Bathyarchaeota archaeon]